MIENMIKFKLEDGSIHTSINVDGKLCAESNGNRPMFCKCIKDSNIDWRNKENWDTACEEGYQFIMGDGVIICPHCGRKLTIVETYETWLEKERENLRIIRKGEDWECGFIYYGLSCTIDYDDWKLIKPYFSYYRRGWSRDEELEWYYGEPTGWLTTKGKLVEIILFKNGLIKEENLGWFDPNLKIEDLLDEVIEELKSEELQKIFDYSFNAADEEAIRKNIHHNIDGTLIEGTDWSIDWDSFRNDLENKNVAWAYSRALQNIQLRR